MYTANKKMAIDKIKRKNGSRVMYLLLPLMLYKQRLGFLSGSSNTSTNIGARGNILFRIDYQQIYS